MEERQEKTTGTDRKVIEGRDKFKVVTDNGFLADASHTITINFIFAGELPPDLAALVREAIAAADSALAKSAAPVYSPSRKKNREKGRNP